MPILCEVSDNYRVDMTDFEAKLDDVEAVIISHMRGHTSDMDAIMALCDARGIGMIVVIFPYSEQLDDPTQDTQPQKYIRRMLRGLDIEYVDLLPAYAEHKAKGVRIFSRFDKGHPLPPGHDLAAGLVREKISEKNMLNI